MYLAARQLFAETGNTLFCDPCAIEIQLAEGCQFTEIIDCRVREARLAEPELLQFLHTRKRRKPSVANSCTTQMQTFETGQSTKLLQPAIGDLGIPEPQVDQLLHVCQLYETRIGKLRFTDR